mgnify:CR=1 FL=1
MKRPYAERVFIVLDIALNVITLGYLNETISSRCGKGMIYGGKPWICLGPIIDWMFELPIVPERYREPHHCVKMIRWDVGYTEERVRQRWEEARQHEDFKGIDDYFERPARFVRKRPGQLG